MTFGEFTKQCELFECSKEYFELVKESSQLDLMRLYIAQQEYIAENADFIKSMTDGYFAESAYAELDTIKAHYYTEADGFMAKIRSGFARLCASVAKFFRNLARRLGGQKNPAAEIKQGLLDALKSGDISGALNIVMGVWKEHKQDIALVAGGISLATGGIMAARHFTMDARLAKAIDKFCKENGLNENEAEGFKKLVELIVATGGKDVVPINTTLKVLSLAQIKLLEGEISQVEEWLKNKNGAPNFDLVKVMNMVKANNGVRTIEIACDENVYNEYATALEKFPAALAKLNDEGTRNSIATATTANRPDNNGSMDQYDQSFNQLTDSLKEMNQYVADTQKFYAVWDRIVSVARSHLRDQWLQNKITKAKDAVVNTVNKVIPVAKNDATPAEEPAPEGTEQQSAEQA